MTKKKTRSQKIKSAERRKTSPTGTGSGFKITFSAMKSAKTNNKEVQKSEIVRNYFRSDLTKVVLLTMLALASEVVLWLILKH